ncbi:ribonuclease HIII [Metabacillus hrfriensis]|uniref:Ribonuclease HIII n=1 Tax=Metabacillus hrfriensis TaxID=3048891 RepID=A0ACD4R8S5_9BACI|nr:ribonuclease HIII [Metabacillus sp. CT-WN-B3]WHZ56753.1 ribonuclease HIII [Metabacillus sp. CT-WN-B3]
MSNAVIKIDQPTILKMKSYYSSDLGSKLPPGAVFTAKSNGCTITAYKSGKVLFQGNLAAEEAEKWSKPEQKTTKKPSKPLTVFSPPANISTLSIIGSDEVGTGDFFGPITVVAAYVKKDQIPLLQELGVKDSKHLNDKQISVIAKNLLSIVPYSLLVLHNEKYNQLQSTGMSQGKMKAILHNQAINKLYDKIEPEVPEAVLIDQFAEPSIYFKHLSGISYRKENTFFSTKAEGIHLAVAAASILARYAFLKEMDRLSEKAGMTLPKGAGAKVDEAAAAIIAKKGESTLRSLTKFHFANTDKAKKLAARKKDR